MRRNGGSSKGGPSNRIEKLGDNRHLRSVTHPDLSYLHQHLVRGDSGSGQHHQPQERTFNLSQHLLAGSTETGRLGSFLSSGVGMSPEASSEVYGTGFPFQHRTDLNATSSEFSDFALPLPPIVTTSPAFSGYENFGGPNPAPDAMHRTPMSFSSGMAERYQPSGDGMFQDTLPYPVPAGVNPPGEPNHISDDVYMRTLASLSSMGSPGTDFGSPRTDLTASTLSSAYERSLAPSTAGTAAGFGVFGTPRTDLTAPPVSPRYPDIQFKNTMDTIPITAVENRADENTADRYLRSLKQKDYSQYTKVYIPTSRRLLEKTSYYIEVGPSSMLNQGQELETFFFHEEKKIVICIPRDTLKLKKRDYRVIPVVSTIMDAIDENYSWPGGIISDILIRKLYRQSGNWFANYLPSFPQNWDGTTSVYSTEAGRYSRRPQASLSSMSSPGTDLRSGTSELPDLTDTTSVYLPESGGYSSFPQNWDGTTSPYSSAHVSSQASPESRWPFTPSTAMTPTGFEDFGTPRTDMTTPSVSSAYERSLAPSTSGTPTGGFGVFGTPRTDMTTPSVSSRYLDIQFKNTIYTTPITAVENRADDRSTDEYVQSLTKKDYSQYTKVYIPTSRRLLEKTSYYIEVGPSSTLNQGQELKTFFFNEKKKIGIFIPKETLDLPKRSYRTIPVVLAVMEAIDSNHTWSSTVLSNIFTHKLHRRSGNWFANYFPNLLGDLDV